MKRRHEFYLDEDVSAQLERLANRPGASKTSVMSAALRAYLDRRASSELDERFRARLDKLSNQLSQVTRDQQIVAESIAGLMLALIRNTPPPITDDRELELEVRERFATFLERVSRRIANGRTVINDVLALTPTSETKQ